MKKFRIFMMALAGIAFLGVYSCQYVAMNDVSVSPDEFDITAGNGVTTRTIAVSMGQGFAWDVTSTVEWITVTNVTGSGFTITVEPYITGTATDIARQGIVVVTSQRGDFPVVVTQERYTGYDITIDPATLTEFVAEGETQTVTITSGAAWTATVAGAAEWIHLTPAEGEDGAAMDIAVDANEGDARTGAITITNGYNEATIDLSQAAPAPAPVLP